MKNKKAPTVLTKEEIADLIISSITDHDVGWATLASPVIASNGKITRFFIESAQWNTADQKFKITIEEA